MTRSGEHPASSAKSFAEIFGVSPAASPPGRTLRATFSAKDQPPARTYAPKSRASCAMSFDALGATTSLDVP